MESEGWEDRWGLHGWRLVGRTDANYDRFWPKADARFYGVVLVLGPHPVEWHGPKFYRAATQRNVYRGITVIKSQIRTLLKKARFALWHTD